jgi:hypothetical protein
MTIQELLQQAGRYPWVITGFFASVPLVAWIVGRLHGRGRGGAPPWTYIYATLVYVSCVPGLFAAVVTAYALFFTAANLLEVNVLVYLLPVVSMTVTLVLVGKNVDFDAVPGFHRLSGLMTLLTVSFVVALAVSRTRLWIVFGGSIFLLFGLAAVAFVCLRWGARALFRRRDEPRDRRPDIREELGRRR